MELPKEIYNLITIVVNHKKTGRFGALRKMLNLLFKEKIDSYKNALTYKYSQNQCPMANKLIINKIALHHVVNP